MMESDGRSEKHRINWPCFFPTGLMLGLCVANISLGLGSLGVDQSIASLVSKAFLFFCFLLCIPSILSQMRKATVIIAFIYVLAITAHYLYYSLWDISVEYLNNTVLIFTTQCLPGLLAILIIKRQDHAIVLRYLKTASIPLAILSGVLLLLGAVGIHIFSIDRYSMGLGYAMALPCIVLLNDYSEENKVFSLVLSMITLLFIVMYGSRGAIIGIALFFVYSVIIRKWMSGKVSIKTIIITTLTILVVLEFRNILIWIYDLLNENGYYSRTLYLLIYDFSHSSHREDLYIEVLNAIRENPWAFRGISADYLLIGTYSHNLIIEIAYEFGLFLAVPIYINLIILVAKSFLSRKSNSLLMIFLFSSLPTLMFSGSFWHNSSFWIWIALSCSAFGDEYEKENTC